MPENDFHGPEFWRLLGAIESGTKQLAGAVEELKERDKRADVDLAGLARKIDGVTERLREQGHKFANELQKVSGQVELVGIGIEGNRAELGVLAKRVEALEEPVRKNIAEREAQRRVWKRVARWAAAIGAVAALMWRTIVEPIWKDVIPHLLQQMFHW
jgi:hypothetical protein